jgi:hypothetical protein
VNRRDYLGLQSCCTKEDRGNVRNFVVTDMYLCVGGRSLEDQLRSARITGALLSAVLAAQAVSPPTPTRFSSKEAAKIAGGAVVDRIKSFSERDYIDGIDDVTEITRAQMSRIRTIFGRLRKEICVEATWELCERHWLFRSTWKKQEGRHVHSTGKVYPDDSDVANAWDAAKEALFK